MQIQKVTLHREMSYNMNYKKTHPQAPTPALIKTN